MALISNSTYSDVAWDEVTEKIKTIISGEYSVNPYIAPEVIPSISSPFRVWPGESETSLMVPGTWQKEYTTSINYYFPNSSENETFYEKLYIEAERLYQLFHNNQTSSGTFTWIDGTVEGIDINKEDDLYNIELIFKCKIARAEGDGVVLPIANTYSLLGDGSNEYVLINNNTNIPGIGDNPYSISMWVKFVDVTTHSNSDGFISFSGGSQPRLYIYLFTLSGVNYIKWVYEKSGGSLSISKTLSTDTNWHHYTFIEESDSSRKIYRDGSLQHTDTTDYDPTNSFTTTAIGAYYTTSANYYIEGNIDETSIWNKALSSDEVTAIYNSGTPIDLSVSAGDYASSGSLVSWWRFGDGVLDDRIKGGLVADQVTPTLGSELSLDPTFDDASDWSSIGVGAGETFDINTTNSGKMTCINAQDVQVYGGNIQTSGDLYKISITIDTYTDGRIQGVNNSAGFAITPSGTGVHTAYYIASGALFNLKIDLNADFTATDISVKKVNGNPGLAINAEAADFEADVPA